MSYFELLEQFWQLDAERTISASASKLYFYLLNEFNTPRWPAKIYRRANQVYADLNVDKKSLATAIATLEERGLIKHVAGNTSRAAEWFLNYGRAAEWCPAKGNNSPQQAPQWSGTEGNNSPSFGTTDPESAGTKGKNSPSIRNRQDQIVEEDQTKKNGSGLSEEITLASLPAENSVSAPRCAAPPVAAALPEALATEAKTLANQIGQLWHISEIKNQPKWARIHTFTRRLATLGRLAEVSEQFAGYRLQREKAGLRPHQLDSWLGKPADDFADGEWCGCDWSAVAADTRTRPGEAASLAPAARVATNTKPQASASWR